MSARADLAPRFARAALLVIASGSLACNAILGLGDYAVGTASDAGADSGAGFDAQSGDQADSTVATTDAADGAPLADATLSDALFSADATTASDAPNCDADPLTFTSPTQCYACAPTTSPQFANACTNSMCVPFDDTRLTNLLSDGALPPVPVKDASSE